MDGSTRHLRYVPRGVKDSHMTCRVYIQSYLLILSAGEKIIFISHPLDSGFKLLSGLQRGGNAEADSAAST